MSVVVEIQSLILNEVHPEWFKSVEPSLIEVARGKQQGRRWMSDYLCDHFEVFTVPDCEWLSVTASKADSQLFFGWADWEELALFLGACTQIQTFRKIVSGEKARTILGHLDSKLSQRLMQLPNRFPDKCQRLKGNEFLPVDVWTRQLVLQGANELYCYARRLHPFLGERIQACFPDDAISTDANAALLDSELFRFCLSGYGREDRNSQIEVG